MRQLGLILLLVASAATAGCGGCSRPPQAPAGTTDQPAVPAGPMYDTLEYANWKKFPVGTVVKRRSITTTEKSASKVVSVSTYRLRSVGDDSAEVVRDNTTERDNDPPVVNAGDINRHRRQFALPAGMTADDFNKPSRGAKKTGEEELTILGKKYKTTVYEWTDSTEAGPLKVKLWVSEDLPGRIAKQTMHQSTVTNRTTEEVIEITIP